jgi:hypothetical protein
MTREEYESIVKRAIEQESILTLADIEKIIDRLGKTITESIAEGIREGIAYPRNGGSGHPPCIIGGYPPYPPYMIGGGG